MEMFEATPASLLHPKGYIYDWENHVNEQVSGVLHF